MNMVEKRKQEREKVTIERKTIVIEEPKVTTEEVDLYVCPSCEEEYREDEMVRVGLGLEKHYFGDEPDYSEISSMCQYCTSAIFDYDGKTGEIKNNFSSDNNSFRRFALWILIIGIMIGFFSGYLFLL